MRLSKEVMFKKVIDVLEDCKASPSKEDANNACGKHIAHQLRSFSQNQEYLLQFKIHELICQCQEQ